MRPKVTVTQIAIAFSFVWPFRGIRRENRKTQKQRRMDIVFGLFPYAIVEKNKLT